MSAPREADIGVDSEEQRCVAGRSTTLPHSRHSLLTAVRMHDPETEKSDEPSTAELRWPRVFSTGGSLSSLQSVEHRLGDSE